MSKNLSTAEALGQFAKELDDAGIDADTAQRLIYFAGSDMIRDNGFIIRAPESTRRCGCCPRCCCRAEAVTR